MATAQSCHGIDMNCASTSNCLSMPMAQHAGTKRKASCPSSHPPHSTAYFPSSSASTSYLPLSPPPAYPASQHAPPVEPSAKRAKKRAVRPSYSELAQWFAELICSVWFTVPLDDVPAQETTLTPACPALTHGTTNFYPSALKPIVLSPTDWTSRRLHPTTDFVSQLRDIFRSLRPSQESLLAASLYVRRFKQLHPNVCGGVGSEFRVAVAGLVLANKLLEDHTYTSKTWSGIVSLPTKLVSHAEAQMWAALNFSIHVTPEQLASWRTGSTSLLNQRTQEIKVSEMAAAAAAAVASYHKASPSSTPLQPSTAPPCAPAPFLRSPRYRTTDNPSPLSMPALVYSPPERVRAPSLSEFTFTPPSYQYRPYAPTSSSGLVPTSMRTTRTMASPLDPMPPTPESALPYHLGSDTVQTTPQPPPNYVQTWPMFDPTTGRTWPYHQHPDSYPPLYAQPSALPRSASSSLPAPYSPGSYGRLALPACHGSIGCQAPLPMQVRAWYP